MRPSNILVRVAGHAQKKADPEHENKSSQCPPPTLNFAVSMRSCAFLYIVYRSLLRVSHVLHIIETKCFVFASRPYEFIINGNLCLFIFSHRVLFMPYKTHLNFVSYTRTPLPYYHQHVIITIDNKYTDHAYLKMKYFHGTQCVE